MARKEERMVNNMRKVGRVTFKRLPSSSTTFRCFDKENIIGFDNYLLLIVCWELKVLTKPETRFLTKLLLKLMVKW